MADAIAAAGAAVVKYAIQDPSRQWPYRAELDGVYVHDGVSYDVAVSITIKPGGTPPHDNN